MERRIAVRGIIIHDDKLLLVKLNDTNILDKDTFCVPGGGLDKNEDIKSGLKREIIEELGVDPVIGRLLFIQQYSSPKHEELDFFFHVMNGSDFTDIDLTKTSHGIKEISHHEFVDPKLERVLPKFLSELDITRCINNNLPVQVFNYL